MDFLFCLNLFAIPAFSHACSKTLSAVLVVIFILVTSKSTLEISSLLRTKGNFWSLISKEKFSSGCHFRPSIVLIFYKRRIIGKGNSNLLEVCILDHYFWFHASLILCNLHSFELIIKTPLFFNMFLHPNNHCNYPFVFFKALYRLHRYDTLNNILANNFINAKLFKLLWCFSVLYHKR